MVRFLIQRPVSVLMTVLVLVILGIITLQYIPVSPLPDISIPGLTVHIKKAGYSGKALEELVVSKLRSELQQVGNLDDISSESRDDQAEIRLRFNYKTDMDIAFLEVNERIDLSMNLLPRDIERPVVNKIDAADLPVLYLNISDKRQGNRAASNFEEISEFASQTVRRRMEQLKEIAFVDITGTVNQQVVLVPLPAVMQELRLSPRDFKQIIEDSYANFSSVTVKNGVFEYSISLENKPLSTVQDIQNIVLKRSGRLLQLKNIARVRVETTQSGGYYYANGRQAVNIAIIKQPSAKMELLRRELDRLLVNLRNEFPDISFETTRDQTELLEYSISNLKQDLFLGSLIALILMAVMLKNIISPLIIAATVPLCLLISLLVFYLAHISINIISLSGLVLGVGLMIDNSIIVIDNINQFKVSGSTLTEACVNGTSQLIRPLITSVLTTCSVFLPLLFMSGITGALFFDQAVAIVVGLSISFVIAVMLIPVIYFLIHSRWPGLFETVEDEAKGVSLMERTYEKGFDWVFTHKGATLMIVFSLLSVNLVLFLTIRKEKMPNLGQNEIQVKIEWNADISLEENRRRVEQMISLLPSRFIASEAMIGPQRYIMNNADNLSISESSVYFKANNATNLQLLKNSLVYFIKRKYPAASLELSPPKDILEQLIANDEPDLSVKLRLLSGAPPPLARVQAVESSLKKKFVMANIVQSPVKQSTRLLIDPSKMILYNLDPATIYEALEHKAGLISAGSIRNGSSSVDVLLRDTLLNISELMRSGIPNSKGAIIPLSVVAKPVVQSDYKIIYGDKDGRYVPVNCLIRDPELMIRLIGNNKLGRDLNYTFSGSFFSNQELIHQMLIILLVSIMLLYFILAAQFESLLQPVIVLLELPISMSGALILVFCFNGSLNAVTMIGLIVMSGIVINDSILKIDTINRLYRVEQLSLQVAIHRAGVSRIKSILMTALTTVLTVGTLIFGTDAGSLLQRPMSLALIGGILIGTPVSLYFIPLIYWWYYNKPPQKTF